MMKKYLFVFIAFALLQVSCSSDDNEPGFKEDRVFQESQFLGCWQYYETKVDNEWLLLPLSCEKEHIAFKKGNILEEFNCFQLNKGSLSFDGKNILKYKTKDGSSYQLNLVSVTDTELIADVSVVKENEPELKNTWKFRKIDFTMDDYYNYLTHGFRVKDTSNFIAMGASGNFLAGIKDNKLWVGSFDANSKEQIYERKDKEDFSFTKRLYMGYGEYKTYTVDNVYATESPDDNLFRLHFNLFDDNKNYITNSVLWFSKSGKKVDCENDNFSLIPWYNDSYIVSNFNSVLCLSQDGDSILSASQFYFPTYESELFAINYNYYIEATKIGNSVYICLNQIVNDGNTAWNRNEISVETEQSDFKYTISVLEKNEQSWKFKVDITEYSGKQHSHIVEMDISGITK